MVSQKNANLAKGKHIIARSNRKDAADILIVFMVKELFNIRKLEIRLVTKDHFGETMKEICDYLGHRISITYAKGI